MLKWQHHTPQKKFSRLTVGGLVVVYLYAIYSILMHTYQKNLAAAYTWPQRYEGEMWMVWAVGALVAALVIGGYIKSLLNRIKVLESQMGRMRRLQAK